MISYQRNSRIKHKKEAILSKNENQIERNDFLLKNNRIKSKNQYNFHKKLKIRRSKTSTTWKNYFIENLKIYLLI
jgi:hypothetical protein